MDKLSAELLQTATQALNDHLARVARQSPRARRPESATPAPAAPAKHGNHAQVLVIHQQTQTF